ncbi:MAG: hypothetical protein RR454_07355, partial [Clostridia bacterium]
FNTQPNSTASENRNANENGNANVSDNANRNANENGTASDNVNRNANENATFNANENGNEISANLESENTNLTEKDTNDVVNFTFQKPDWHEKVKNFLNENPDANDFSEEIAQEILDNEQLARKDDCLMLAYNKALKNSIIEPAKLIDDENFVNEHILGNEKILNYVLQQYFNSLSQNQPPKVIKNGGNISITPAYKPKTIKEAGELTKNIFNLRS